MATTTMSTPNEVRRASNQTVYWVIGSVLVIALALFFALRPAPTTDVLPTTVERTAPPATNSVAPVETTDRAPLSPTNPANPPAGTVPGTDPAANRY